MIDVLNEDYITCAYARGLSKREVYSKYALRNSMIPVITIYGTSSGRYAVRCSSY